MKRHIFAQKQARYWKVWAKYKTNLTPQQVLRNTISAMSAATMIACAANEIVMGKHSFLGPIDPQLILNTGIGPRAVPAQAILDQFNRAQVDAADPIELCVWAPMLSQYGPDLLVTCQNQLDLAQELVSEWLENYMLRGRPDAKSAARSIAEWLSTHNNFQTHSRPLSRDIVQAKGLVVRPLENNQAEQDAVLSVYHTTARTFSATPTVKIIESHLGKAFLKMAHIQIAGPQPPQLPPVPPPTAAPPSPPPGTGLPT